MKEQIIKGWVTIDDNESEEIYLLKSKPKEIDLYEYDNRQLSKLIINALSALGYRDLSDGDEDFENGISDKRVAENVVMQLFASDKQEKLDAIKEHVILDSMGLLEFQEGWCVYSTWTITGYEIDTFKLGGHDLLQIIESLEGKYIYLIIDRYVEKESK